MELAREVRPTFVEPLVHHRVLLTVAVQLLARVHSLAELKLEVRRALSECAAVGVRSLSTRRLERELATDVGELLGLGVAHRA